MCTTGRASAAFRCARNAEPRRRHGLEPGVGNVLAAGFALPVCAALELAERGVDLEQRFAQRVQQRVDLAPLGGDLTGVGEAVVIRVAIDAECSELAPNPLALGSQLGASAAIG